MSTTLTGKEILDLARYAGIITGDDPVIDQDILDTEYTVSKCHPDGVMVEGSDEEPVKYNHVAYHSEYPEEGVYPLGNPTTH